MLVLDTLWRRVTFACVELGAATALLPVYYRRDLLIYCKLDFS
jgi:hypothetical protein